MVCFFPVNAPGWTVYTESDFECGQEFAEEPAAKQQQFFESGIFIFLLTMFYLILNLLRFGTNPMAFSAAHVLFNFESFTIMNKSYGIF